MAFAVLGLVVVCFNFVISVVGNPVKLERESLGTDMTGRPRIVYGSINLTRKALLPNATAPTNWSCS
jgi:HKD family nuclease